MYELKKETYKKISAHRGIFRVKSKLTNIGEVFELYVNDVCVVSFQEQGFKDLGTVLADFNNQYIKREKEYGSI